MGPRGSDVLTLRPPRFRDDRGSLHSRLGDRRLAGPARPGSARRPRRARSAGDGVGLRISPCPPEPTERDPEGPLPAVARVPHAANLAVRRRAHRAGTGTPPPRRGDSSGRDRRDRRGHRSRVPLLACQPGSARSRKPARRLLHHRVLRPARRPRVRGPAGGRRRTRRRPPPERWSTALRLCCQAADQAGLDPAVPAVRALVSPERRPAGAPIPAEISVFAPALTEAGLL